MKFYIKLAISFAMAVLVVFVLDRCTRPSETSDVVTSHFYTKDGKGECVVLYSNWPNTPRSISCFPVTK